jgi:hypothetical protein
MNNLFLSKESVENLTYEECQSALEALAKAYDFDAHVSPQMTGIWPVIDDIVDTLLYLEDRIKRFEDPRIPSMDPDSDTIARPVIPPKQPKSTDTKQVRRRRKFRVDNVIYDSVMDASERLGLKEHTLRNYVSRDPRKYGFVD